MKSEKHIKQEKKSEHLMADEGTPRPLEKTVKKVNMLGLKLKS
jgi:hypothetical protein